MDTNALAKHAQGEIKQALAVISKFSQEMLVDPVNALRFSRQAFSATAKLNIWKGILAHLDAGGSAKRVMESSHENIMRMLSTAPISANAQEATLNSEMLGEAAYAYKKLEMFVKCNGDPLSLL